jgi:sigma-54-specific transcriptional regulator
MIIRTAYRYCKNNQVQTARLLGLSRNILRSQLKYFGLIGYAEAVVEKSTSTESFSEGEKSVVHTQREYDNINTNE